MLDGGVVSNGGKGEREIGDEGGRESTKGRQGGGERVGR